MSDRVKLTVAFGERSRVRGRFLADELVDLLERHGVQESIFLRGIEGFGPSQQLRTDRLLSLSEDLPLIVAAIDRREVIEAVLAEADGDLAKGLIAVGHVWVPGPGELVIPWHDEADTKLTVRLGRHDQVDRRPADRWVVGRLHNAGFAGATLLVGVDGTRHGRRRRAALLGSSAEVPATVIAVGDSDRAVRVAPQLVERLPGAAITLEPVRVLRRDGAEIGTPPAFERGAWAQLTLYAGEQARQDGEPIHQAFVRRLRRQDAAGATSVRGVWGFHGEHAPHGDQLLQLRRRVPIMTTVIDRAERIREWLAVAGELTADTGLVTIEAVPVVHPRTPDGPRHQVKIS